MAFDPQTRYSLLIQGGTVIDGSGAPGRRADVVVHRGTIVFVGAVNASTVRAERVIDARGKVVTPGFIDAHAHGDPFATPEFRNFLAMGVTTICLGQDGESPEREDLSSWMQEVDDAQPALNVALFVGHGTVRTLAGVGLKEKPSAEDLGRMSQLVAAAMDTGCFGLTTGLEYDPGRFAVQEELVALARPVAQRGGLVMSHLRTEDDDQIESALDELLAQGLGANCAVHVSHMKVVYGKGARRAEELLVRLQAVRDQGLGVSADLYPYTASHTTIDILFPDWARPPHDYGSVAAARRADLQDYLRHRITRRNGPEATLLTSAPWTGKTLAQVAVELGKPFEDILIDDIRPGGASAAYFVIDPALMERLLVDPHVMISSDGSPEMRHPRSYGTFARILRTYVAEKHLLTLEEAVHKMTGLTASTIGLDRVGRGRVDSGFQADLLVFDPTKVRDAATFENPHEVAEGFEWVIVNGRLVRDNGQFTAERPGGILRRN